MAQGMADRVDPRKLRGPEPMDARVAQADELAGRLAELVARLDELRKLAHGIGVRLLGDVPTTSGEGSAEAGPVGGLLGDLAHSVAAGHAAADEAQRELRRIASHLGGVAG